ncbi:putative F-box domain-containing protein [Arabidopsis thaliana]
MEKREEKKREIQRITKSSSTCNGVSSDEYIPIDLTWEILMRLPAKSIVRFRCVSKLWWSITTQQDFINSFALRQSSILCQSLLLTFMAKDDQHKQVLYMLSFHENFKSYSDVNDFHNMPPTEDCHYYNYSASERTYNLAST